MNLKTMLMAAQAEQALQEICEERVALGLLPAKPEEEKIRDLLTKILNGKFINGVIYASVQLTNGEVAKIGFVGAMNPEEVDLMKMFVDGCIEQAKDSYGGGFPNPKSDSGPFTVVDEDDDSCQCTNCVTRREIMASIKKDQV